MKPNRLVLLTTLALLLSEVNAFQFVPQRISLRKFAPPSKLLPTITVDAPSNISKKKLLSRSTILTKPFTKLVTTNKNNNKQILSIVTTCLFTCLIRPRIANAASFAFLLDPTTLLTYEVPGIEIPRIYNLNGVLSRLNSPWWLLTSSLAVATALGTVIYGGLVYWLSFLDNYEVGTYDDYNDEDMYAYDDDENKEGKAKHVDWNVYSRVLLDGRKEKKHKVHDAKKIGKSEYQYEIKCYNKVCTFSLCKLILLYCFTFIQHTQ